MAERSVARKAGRIWKAMRRAKVLGVPAVAIVGGGDPELIAEGVVRQIHREIPLREGLSVLDVGCGCGRIAVALRPHLGRTGRYLGIDIVPGLVRFARWQITPRFWRFRFVLRDQMNASYEPFIGKRGPAGRGIRLIREACPDDSIDLAIAVSLFTHLEFGPARAMLREIAFALRQEGRAFLTFFVVDDEVRAAQARGAAHFAFRSAGPDGLTLVENTERPTDVAGYARDTLDALFAETGLAIERVIRGNWSGLTFAETLQDAVVARRIGAPA